MLLHKCQDFHLFEQQTHIGWKYLNYDRLWENRKFLFENQCFDWIKLIHWYRLVNNGWLADINLFLTQQFYLLNHNPYERKHCGKAWLIRARTLQILWDSVHILKLARALNNLSPYGWQLKLSMSWSYKNHKNHYKKIASFLNGVT